MNDEDFWAAIRRSAKLIARYAETMDHMVVKLAVVGRSKGR